VGIQVAVEIDKQIKLSHLLLNDRKCRVCDELKNLVGEFYRTRKDRDLLHLLILTSVKNAPKKE
jgi:hypothetical protein